MSATRTAIVVVCLFIVVLAYSLAIALDEAYRKGYRDGTAYGESLGYIECQAEKVPVECFPQWEERQCHE